MVELLLVRQRQTWNSVARPWDILFSAVAINSATIEACFSAPPMGYTRRIAGLVLAGSAGLFVTGLMIHDTYQSTNTDIVGVVVSAMLWIGAVTVGYAAKRDRRSGLDRRVRARRSSDLDLRISGTAIDLNPGVAAPAIDDRRQHGERRMSATNSEGGVA